MASLYCCEKVTYKELSDPVLRITLDLAEYYAYRSRRVLFPNAEDQGG